eukprot:jgi/Chlat1/3630/Chrsp237S03623
MEDRPLRVVVIGPGGVGGYIAARLIEAGCEVHLVARGAAQQAGDFTALLTFFLLHNFLLVGTALVALSLLLAIQAVRAPQYACAWQCCKAVPCASTGTVTLNIGAVHNFLASVVTFQGQLQLKLLLLIAGNQRQGLARHKRCWGLHASVHASPKDIQLASPADAVVFAVKAWQLHRVAEDLASSGHSEAGVNTVVGERTALLPTQNGVEAPEVLAEVFGKERVFGGYFKIFARIQEPGHILHTCGNPAIWGVGPTPTTNPDIAAAFIPRMQAVFAKVRGLSLAVESDIIKGMWTKLAALVAHSASCTVTRAPLGIVHEVPEAKAIHDAILHEIGDVARAHDVDLTHEDEGELMARKAQLVPTAYYETPSMMRDVLEGLPSELEDQLGVVVKLAKEKSVPVPVTSIIYGALLPQELRARGQLKF